MFMLMCMYCIFTCVGVGSFACRLHVCVMLFARCVPVYVGVRGMREH